MKRVKFTVQTPDYLLTIEGKQGSDFGDMVRIIGTEIEKNGWVYDAESKTYRRGEEQLTMSITIDS